MSARPPAAATDPLDAGNGVVCASFARSGDWLSVGATHPVHGFVELSAAPRFDERYRGDPEATRRYRSSLADPRNAFLRIVPLRHAPRHEVELHVEPGARAIRQRHRFTGEPTDLEVRVRGWLDRPALAEITELDPPLATGAITRFVVGRRLQIRADQLPACAAVEVRDAAGGRLSDWHPADGAASLRIEWPPASPELELEVMVALECSPTADGPRRPATTSPAWRPTMPSRRDGPRLLIVPDSLASGIDRIAATNLAYVAGCTTLLVAPDERTILTDHRLLPLSWTRDAYYQALLLLATDEEHGAATVADHLRWLWLRCERPDGAWMRSHHANGARKDIAFQADQQLYPLLELADYWRAVGSLPVLPPGSPTWGRLVADVWGLIEEVADHDTFLISSEENPADDPARLPYLFSAQLLGWYTARRLAELEPVIGLDGERLRARSEQLRTALEQRFSVNTDRWAYAIDGSGQAEDYHDANDLPTALAPLWGFCEGGDPRWLATMRFAFSDANPAFFDGSRAGLGSLHTAQPWALGDVQAWVHASLMGDERRAEAALQRLLTVAFDDGLLPEAYTANGDLVRIRRWFAWPGAALAALWLLDRRGLLAERLRA